MLREQEVLLGRLAIDDDSPASLKEDLARGGLHCTLDWVTACLDWLAGEHGNLSRQAAVLKLQVNVSQSGHERLTSVLCRSSGA